jgi:flagellar basal body-associated protein FliL
MADTPTQPNAQTPSSEIPLADIDALLKAEDPEFTQSLDEVRAVAPDSAITIEASVTAEPEQMDDKIEGEFQGSRWEKLKLRYRTAMMGFRQRLKARLRQFGKDLLIFLKNRPKEFFFFLLAIAKVAAQKAVVPLKAFQEASLPQRLVMLLLVAMVAAAGWILRHNLKGVWLPHINEPILASFTDVADHVETFDRQDDGESFYAAFPQERYEFLFGKMKVNLRQTPENPLPMGAFELVVVLDSKDTAIEVRDREVEFSDLLQRVLEGESFNDLSSELGKARLKSRIKRELNQQLTQGWIKDVNFKTFILKP